MIVEIYARRVPVLRLPNGSFVSLQVIVQFLNGFLGLLEELDLAVGIESQDIRVPEIAQRVRIVVQLRKEAAIRLIAAARSGIEFGPFRTWQ